MNTQTMITIILNLILCQLQLHTNRLGHVTNLGSCEGPDWSRSRNSQFWPRYWAYSMRPLTGFFSLTSCNLAQRFWGGAAASDTATVPMELAFSAASFSASVSLRMALRKSGISSVAHCPSLVSSSWDKVKVVGWREEWDWIKKHKRGERVKG